MANELTALEVLALTNMLTSDYGDGDTRTVWDFCATGGALTKKSVGGVVASLQRKGFVVCSGRGQDATITITAIGAAAYRMVVPSKI